ncbi:phosphatidylinositol transfer protein 3-like isoform X1 [Abrus precatorius]|uniref:Phosphatidylinositol transfer protein 3-like isoform X1 n=1 Tax=Abrus precatorius TaxID=3816 RepID=A0A8B8L248_ABRPR|nr:phosphatidylinositol transfer protein 3-like isoform X1 [Abrus precatorius]XP_027350261.1 phosphatidylinositol transfer protein 3-like isoform X1 [Abrus precatorius]XP_027350262.1 phosphatidylinositol transfer protein 3-like isoform X1 [Abrus precatorius]XP_027350263.1 phosphatidylinositol transfer protein 3-like isoform X1 [Abrus precatorius]XP_027350264.1 phosphatidylinositol transfer protein 3-like isoform X1 [Abrus precatorius]XP_027350265.1 phosphatidylinositol transfer protein 3-like 
MSFKKLKPDAAEKTLSAEEQQAKIGEVRKIIGPIADKFSALCSDASVLRYLRARNYNSKKAAKMLKGTMKWKLEFKPEKIRWDDVVQEAARGRLYRADYLDKQGRTVFVIKPGIQSTNSGTEQIKYLVYCLENAILNQSSNQEQMVWLIDFQGWSTSCLSLKVTRDTAQILQAHYPERLGRAIFYNPPKVFESFWKMVKPFLEPKTYKKVTFVYLDNPRSLKIMEELFDMDKLEASFGGKSTVGFNYEAYAKKMREDDRRLSDVIDSGISSPSLLKSFNELQHAGDNDSEDETSSDEAVHSKLEEDYVIKHGKMSCSQYEPKNEVHEPKKCLEN